MKLSASMLHPWKTTLCNSEFVTVSVVFSGKDYILLVWNYLSQGVWREKSVSFLRCDTVNTATTSLFTPGITSTFFKLRHMSWTRKVVFRSSLLYLSCCWVMRFFCCEFSVQYEIFHSLPKYNILFLPKGSSSCLRLPPRLLYPFTYPSTTGLRNQFLCNMWKIYLFARFQASSTKQIRTGLFWIIRQRVAVISYRRFGTTYRSHHGSRIQKQFWIGFLNPEDGTDRLSRNVGKNLPLLAA